MKILFLIVLLFSQWAQATIEIYEFPDPAHEQRYRALTEELRCLVCQNQNIADSHAELAQDLRRKVYEMINAGQSDDQIVQFMIDRYGDFVLYRPPLNPKTMILWLAPVLTVAAGLFGFWFLLKRRRQNDQQPSDADLQRIRDLLKKSDNQ
ncbi:MAG: cytochrome c-type biogenesis protein CcmH [Methylicorpusculum sp.]|uniref:cytochrome c-type biogenesis protein n=1 Tax=Methylicorpusculum sp. TaxID=2713644 RepID=UPI00272297DF|nr:cytochrome c-type biogenesis protein [Methylicorpusculum sp.]MDO8939714.1 cytochrome c-type biogenesis protein CcmH [Methylicorpusculum sp.]MDO9242051.1 cytochrome c-type biogenesis protein CcmH [Methylicorpusculum sp.]MDP2176969.1 cytochrome c-type biogenesis protein CcmH [Methylicorpusculum sp.]MDP2204602.1 cytochrome c-type biogenesis protein CcmH [Methylicorpusculum sp.]MDP3528739.1 cytochrome c-type biogenesis protein CcmH [Methylicorpusculum sp.]